MTYHAASPKLSMAWELGIPTACRALLFRRSASLRREFRAPPRNELDLFSHAPFPQGL